MFFETSYLDGLGAGNEQPSDPRERERIARIGCASLSTVTPGGVYVPMPCNLPDGSVGIGIRSRMQAGGSLDPWRDVVILLQPGGAPGEAYSWPVVASADAFIRPGSASGFPVRDFFCGFHPGICDHLTRAATGAGPNPCWGKPSGTCDPAKYAQTGGAISPEVARLLAQPGLTRSSVGVTAVAQPVTATGTSMGVAPTMVPVTLATGASLAASASQSGTVLDQVGSALGLPAQVSVGGFQISPVMIGLAALGAYFFFGRK